MKPIISYDDFSKLDLRVGEVVEAKEVEGSTKLLELKVDFGEEIGQKTIYAGVREWYESSKMTGRKLVFVVNLAPKTFKIRTPRKSSGTLRSSASPAGLWQEKEYISEGMLIAAGGDRAYLYTFDEDIPNGTILR